MRGMGASRSESHFGGLAGSLENAKFWFQGVTWRQAIILGAVTYASLIVLITGKNFLSSNPSPVAHSNNNMPLTITGEQANAIGREEMLEFGSSNDDAINASGLDLGSSIADSSNEEEDDDRYADLRSTLYQSSVVFTLNYEEMMSKFKIFIYPGGQNSFRVLSGSSKAEDLHHTDDFFVHQLYHSDFVTLDPEKAHLLFLPISIRGLVEDTEVGPHKVGKVLNKYVQSLRDDYPHWARTLGADHVVVSCHEAKEDGSRNVLELKKNAIQITCSPLDGSGGSQAFFPHKDVAMPLYQTDSPTQQQQRDMEGFERTTLAYYHGSTGVGSFYETLDVSWDNDDRFAFESEEVEVAIHHQRLASSKFCLILGPKDYSDIVNALRFGCVPVLVSDGKLYDLPFQDILNWNQFAVIVSLRNVKNMESMLSAVDEQQYVTMQYLGKEASKHLEWHNPAEDQDAFYMVLYDLWIRRHAIRYVRREEL